MVADPIPKVIFPFGLVLYLFVRAFLLRFTLCNAEQSLRGMEVQKKKKRKKETKKLKHTGNLFRKILQLKGVY